MKFTFGILYEKQKEVTALSEQITALTLLVNSLQEQLTNLAEISTPTWPIDFAADDTWNPMTSTISSMVTDFGADDNWGASPAVLISGNWGTDDHWSATIA